MQAWADDLARALKPRWGLAALLLAAIALSVVAAKISGSNSGRGY